MVSYTTDGFEKVWALEMSVLYILTRLWEERKKDLKMHYSFIVPYYECLFAFTGKAHGDPLHANVGQTYSLDRVWVCFARGLA